MALKYVGKDLNNDWLPGVPARDLTDEEVKQYPEAKRSRFYEEKAPRAPRQPRAKRTTKKEAAPAAEPAATPAAEAEE